MHILKYSVLVILVFLVGCGGPPLIQDSASQALPPPPSDKAQIVFLNPANSIAAAFYSSIYKLNDINSNDREFYGMLGSMQKLYVNVEPGQHTFMAYTGVSHFLKADVQAGKRYYVGLRFIYRQGLQLRPVRKSGEDEFNANNPKFPGWVKESRFVTKTAQADIWYQDYVQRVNDGQKAAVTEWKKKTESERAELTLNKGDHLDKY